MKLALVDRDLTDDERNFKEWLTKLLPADRGRNAVAQDFGVSRRTIANMLNPKSSAWANGYTMLRYLRLVEALKDPPAESAASSRLVRIEELARTNLAITEQAVRSVLPAFAPEAKDLQQAAKLVDLLQEARTLLDDDPPEEMTP